MPIRPVILAPSPPFALHRHPHLEESQTSDQATRTAAALPLVLHSKKAAFDRLEGPSVLPAHVLAVSLEHETHRTSDRTMRASRSLGPTEHQSAPPTDPP